MLETTEQHKFLHVTPSFNTHPTDYACVWRRVRRYLYLQSLFYRPSPLSVFGLYVELLPSQFIMYFLGYKGHITDHKI